LVATVRAGECGQLAHWAPWPATRSSLRIGEGARTAAPQVGLSALVCDTLVSTPSDTWGGGSCENQNYTYSLTKHATGTYASASARSVLVVSFIPGLESPGFSDGGIKI
jgi:hypothetical protein